MFSTLRTSGGSSDGTLLINIDVRLMNDTVHSKRIRTAAAVQIVYHMIEPCIITEYIF